MAELFVGTIGDIVQWPPYMGTTKHGAAYLSHSVNRKAADGTWQKVKFVIWDNAAKAAEYLTENNATLVIYYDKIDWDKVYQKADGSSRPAPEFVGDYAVYAIGLNSLGEPALIHLSGKMPNATPVTTPPNTPPTKGVVMEPLTPTIPVAQPNEEFTPPARVITHEFAILAEQQDRLDPLVDRDETTYLPMLKGIRDAWFPNRSGPFINLLTTGQMEFLIQQFDDAIVKHYRDGQPYPARDVLIERVNQAVTNYMGRGGNNVAALRTHITGNNLRFAEQVTTLTDGQLFGLAVAFEFAPVKEQGGA